MNLLSHGFVDIALWVLQHRVSYKQTIRCQLGLLLPLNVTGPGYACNSLGDCWQEAVARNLL